mmetsp:Transcript_9381/g.13561  ORF Transcript_9381/g.13561 Transcript_9381/m.13561 type:complete len:96 (-) Transcript_9381:890-1177(-)
MSHFPLVETHQSDSSSDDGIDSIAEYISYDDNSVGSHSSISDDLKAPDDEDVQSIPSLFSGDLSDSDSKMKTVVKLTKHHIPLSSHMHHHYQRHL